LLLPLRRFVGGGRLRGAGGGFHLVQLESARRFQADHLAAEVWAGINRRSRHDAIFQNALLAAHILQQQYSAHGQTVNVMPCRRNEESASCRSSWNWAAAMLANSW
jgi:hypothetical protein